MLHIWCYYCIFKFIHLISWEVFSSTSSWFYSLFYHNNNIEHFFCCLLPMLTLSFLNGLFKIFVYFFTRFSPSFYYWIVRHFHYQLYSLPQENRRHLIDDQGDFKCKGKVKVCNSRIHNYSEGAIGFWVEWHNTLFTSEF